MNHIEVERQGPVARVWLNRPELRNAFNATAIAELTHVFKMLAVDQALRVVVLGGRGKAFCAGGDLNWMRAMAGYSWDENHADAGRLAEMLWSVASCPVPVVARVQGDAYAGGLGLVAACDIAVAANTAGFCLSEAKIGLVPATISPYVIRAIGERQARRYFVTAERFDAARAQAIGLVHEACDADALDAALESIVQAIAANGPQAVRASKRVIADVAGAANTAELRDRTARLIADVRASEEGRAGLQAFLNKTTPPWT